eukprot:2440610-Pleurochrysis_carterae.AAC.3
MLYIWLDLFYLLFGCKAAMIYAQKLVMRCHGRLDHQLQNSPFRLYLDFFSPSPLVSSSTASSSSSSSSSSFYSSSLLLNGVWFIMCSV